MENSRTFLLELGLEDLPTKAVSDLSSALGDALVAGLAGSGLAHGEVEVFGSPRRLAVSITSLTAQQPDQHVEKRGPALKAAFDADGNPTRAATGFASSCGVAVDALGRLETDKGTWLQYTATVPGSATSALLPAIVETAVRGLPIAKRMRWGNHTHTFVRPLKWLVALFGDAIVDMTLFGIAADRTSFGHRFHAPGPIVLANAGEYKARLETEGRVVVSFADRRARIEAAVTACAQPDATPVIDAALLDEVTALVEWPVALTGRFDADFLSVPKEALIAVMQDHQKYFHMLHDDGTLAPAFVFISNIESRDPKMVVGGNERVIAPRLADARFFYDRDRQQPLASRAGRLGTVTYQKRLGTLADKTVRVRELAEGLAKAMGLDVAITSRAAELSRCDLTASMVFEFPELQGIAGRYYALNDGESDAVAQAIEDFYHPRFASDSLPGSREAQALAVADRIDTLVGIFGIGQPPSGDKDPFGLRRAALGIIRIAIEAGFDFDLDAVLEQAAGRVASLLNETVGTTEVRQFMLDRLRYWYQDRGVDVSIFNAVAALPLSRLTDFDARVRAVQAFSHQPEAAALAAANKRSSNLLRKANEEGELGEGDVNVLGETETALATALAAAKADTLPLLDKGDYETALQRMSALRPPVDAFFDGVMVLDPDPTVRANRLGLLRELCALFRTVADIGELNA